jgi:Ca-activated chloride channel homolog
MLLSGGIHMSLQEVKIHSFRKIGIIMSIILLFQFWTSGAVQAEPNVSDSSNFDVVFVLDSTLTLKTTDPESIRLQAVRLFIDMLHTKGDRAALVAFDSTIIRESGLLPLDSDSDKAKFKGLLDGLKLGGWTDIGLALKKAADILEKQHDKTKKPVIIFLSDAINDPDPSKDKDGKISKAYLDAAMGIIIKNQYPVYAIGLDGSERLRADEAFLKDIAAKTGGKHYIAKKAASLKNILNEIYAEITNSTMNVIGEEKASGSFQDFKIDISYTGMAEVNISVDSSSKTEIRMVDPNGKEYAASTTNVILSSSEKYSAVKLINPVKGQWVLKVKGKTNDIIKVNTVINNEFKLVTDLKEDTKLHKGQTLKVNAHLENDIGRIEDEALYKALKGKLIVKKLSDSSISEVNLEYRDKSFSGEFVVPDRGNYELQIKVEGEGFSKQSPQLTITAENRAPITVGKPEKINLSPDGKDKLITLSQYFKDEDGDELTYSISEGSKDFAVFSITGDSLNVRPVKKGSTTLVVTADDKNGGTVTQSFEVSVTSKLFHFASEMYVIFILGFIILASAGLLVANEIKLRKFK